MTGHALSPDQINNIVNNTMVVLLARPDLLPDWHENLLDLLRQTREHALEEEMLFVAAVVTLLNSPDDTLPTGTSYDYAWQSLLSGLATGVVQPMAQNDDEALEQLLQSVAEAVVVVMTTAPDHRDAIRGEIEEIRESSRHAGLPGLTAWLDDLLALLTGTPLSALTREHSDRYGAYWDAIVSRLNGDSPGTPPA